MLQSVIDQSVQLYITMFGGFSIRAGDKQISDSVARTHQLWHLIEYLVAFRNKSVSQEELIDALWPEGDIDNPANALKNLVYRAHTTLASHSLPFAKEMIIYNRGSYTWNNNLPCLVDCELFDEAYKNALMTGQTIDQKTRRYQEVIDLYRGDFLPGARFEAWVVPIASGYRSQFFRCVYALLEILYEQQRYSEMEEVCRKAIEVDQFEEKAHHHLILSLIRQGKQAQAMSHYNQVTELFFRELGVSLSSSMRSLYREIVKTVHNVETDLGIIKEDLRESEGLEGAFFCEYEVFKDLYRLEARSAARSGMPIFINLLTVESPDGESLDVKLLNKVMDSLHDIVQGSLRKGDVFSRFSACQYVLMLPALTFENCNMVMDRIVKQFRHVHRNRNVSIFCKSQPLDPIDSGH